MHKDGGRALLTFWTGLAFLGTLSRDSTLGFLRNRHGRCEWRNLEIFEELTSSWDRLYQTWSTALSFVFKVRSTSLMLDQ